MADTAIAKTSSVSNGTTGPVTGGTTGGTEALDLEDCHLWRRLYWDTHTYSLNIPSFLISLIFLELLL
eukprot:6029987-Amphidinium_carterae.1